MLLSRVEIADESKEAYIADASHGRPNAFKAAEPQTFGSEGAEYGEMQVGRNEKCPCGSGRKFKHCHGKLNMQKTA